MNGINGSDSSRNTVIDENAARETLRALLIGMMKNASPYPVNPALIILLKKVTTTITQP
jgi:hypothetical protein